jgi:uncharacterized protein YjbI with pentapeptide repeats
MANPDHLAKLKEGVEVWNRWRKEHPEVRPDLYVADLSESNLVEVHFTGAQLGGANLIRANLRNADLSDADLSHAHLNYADLSHADLIEVDLSHADLSHSDLSGAYIARTIFGDIDLSEVKGLDSIIHGFPSTIGTDTIIRSQGRIPEIFLRRAGVPESIIEAIPSLIGSLKPIDYYSCFISYSSKDEDFAKRLYADLQQENVRCWFAREDLKIGDKFWHRIDECIKLYDKLLVVLSEHSVQSDWVEREVMAALEKEKQGKTVLFPITLDDAVKDCTGPWAADIRRSRHIGDFRVWKNHDDYQKAFARLLRDLKASS